MSDAEHAALQMLHAIVGLAAAQFGDLRGVIANPTDFADHIAHNANKMCELLEAFENSYEGLPDGLPMLYRAQDAWTQTYSRLTNDRIQHAAE